MHSEITAILCANASQPYGKSQELIMETYKIYKFLKYLRNNRFRKNTLLYLLLEDANQRYI